MRVDSELSMRKETVDDKQFVFDLFSQIHSERLGLSDYALLAPLLQQQFAAQTRSFEQHFPSATYFVAQVGFQPVGRLVLHREHGCFRVVDIMILPAQQGRGFGRWLLNNVLDEANEAGVATRLSVSQDNIHAKRLYKKLGFRAELSRGLHEEWVRSHTVVNAV
ncbi:GNAT family N-acetyltransferase [Neptunomonas marina]|nr:GNAT family N-acetyltransferase [Neptunomonas marina]